MVIIDSSSKKRHRVEVLPVEEVDYKSITKSRYFFDWKEEKNQEVYKLVKEGSKNILGLVSIERMPSEWRIHIRLLTVSKENKGKVKEYEGIAGNLIAFVSKLSVVEYGALACVSLQPKTQIAQHYINKYKMTATGITLSIEVPEILNLINDYDNDK